MKTIIQIIQSATFICCALFININSNLAATVTWNGAKSDWNIANNWDTGTIPVAGDEVYIPSGEVFLPTGYTGAAMHVEISNGAKLQLRKKSTLNVDGAVDKSGVLNHGILLVYGSLNISNVTGSTSPWTTGNGIANTKQLYVGPKGIIDIQNVVNSGINCNEALAKMTNTGEIIIDNTEENGIFSIGKNYNNGEININLINNTNATGITTNNLFKNHIGAAIYIENGHDGIAIVESSSQFKNWGAIDCIDQDQNGISNSGVFNNFTEGEIYVNSAGLYNFLNKASGIFSNSGSCALTFGEFYGFGNVGVAANYNDIQINENEGTALAVFSGSQFDNYSSLGLLNNSNVDLLLQGTLHNHPSSKIIHYVKFILFNSGSFINDGFLSSFANIVHFKQPAAIFTNNGVIVDRFGRLAPVANNQQVIATTLQDGVPYSPALSVVATNNVEIEEWSILGSSSFQDAGTYDEVTNTYTPNNLAIGHEALYVGIRIAAGSIAIYCELLLDVPVLPFKGDPSNEMQFRSREENFNQPEFLVFPNPTSEQISLSNKSNGSGNTQIRVMNSLGQFVYEQHFTKEEENLLFELPTSLSDGIYFINIYQEERLKDTKRIQLVR